MRTNELHTHFVIVLVHHVRVHNGGINDKKTLFDAIIGGHAFVKYKIHEVDHTHQFHTCALGNVLILG